MVSEEKHFEFAVSVVAERHQATRNAFKLFLQLFSVIIGGSIWLTMQPTFSASAKGKFIFVSDTLVLLVIIVTGAMVLEDLRGWWNYREVLAKFSYENHPISRPKLRAVLIEAIMLLCMGVAGIIFIVFNPFRAT
jgi:hypothetical protein